MEMNSPYYDPGKVHCQFQEIVTGSGLEGNVNWEEVRRFGGCVASRIEHHKTLPRAMDHGRNLIDKASLDGRSFPSGTVIIADSMTHSKGRFTREWYAPPGGLWGCLVLANTLLPAARRFIPLAVGVSCCQTFRDFGCSDATLRWVNDVLSGGRKRAGFLVETYNDRVHREDFTLVGFGVNLNNSSFEGDLGTTAGSLAQVLGHTVDLGSFTHRFLARLGCCIGLLAYEEARELRGETFSGQGGMHLLLDWWRRLSDTVGKRVVYGFDVMTAPQYEARVVEMNCDGGLVLHHDDGTETTEYSGEVRYLPEGNS